MEAQQPRGKLRLMCSYGGQILPRPPTYSLFYVGGDTRIVSIDRRTVTSLSSLVSHLSSALSLNSPFSLKYRLPHLDLDSLITLASDDDFHILIDEHNRLSSTTSRIRLFLFPLIPHPKTEAWFFDALKNANIMQNAMHPDDSMILETGSSFGSASSSASFTNFHPIRPHAEDNDTLFKFTSSDTFPSDNSVSSIVSTQQNISYQYKDPAVEARLSAESTEVGTKMPCISSQIIENDTNMVDKGLSSFPQFNQVERPHLQLVQAAAHFLPLHSNDGLLQVASSQLVYQPPRPLQHLTYHHPNQPCPVYLVPAASISSNSCQASFNVNASSVNYRAAQNAEVGAGSTLPHGFSSQNYFTDNATTSFVYVPCNGSQRQELDIYPMHPHSQNISVSVTSRESPKYGNELEYELSHAQIYKSQPPPPSASAPTSPQ